MYKHGPVFNAVKGRMQSQTENSTQAVLVDTSRTNKKALKNFHVNVWQLQTYMFIYCFYSCPRFCSKYQSAVIHDSAGRMCGWRYCRRQHHIRFLRISSAIWAQVAPEWRACESAHVLAEWRIRTQNGACSRPVNAWVDPLQNWPAKQDVDPRVENLVPGGKTYPKDQESDLHGASRQGSLGNEDLMTVGYEAKMKKEK